MKYLRAGSYWILAKSFLFVYLWLLSGIHYPGPIFVFLQREKRQRGKVITSPKLLPKPQGQALIWFAQAPLPSDAKWTSTMSVGYSLGNNSVIFLDCDLLSYAKVGNRVLSTTAGSHHTNEITFLKLLTENWQEIQLAQTPPHISRGSLKHIKFSSPNCVSFLTQWNVTRSLSVYNTSRICYTINSTISLPAHSPFLYFQNLQSLFWIF